MSKNTTTPITAPITKKRRQAEDLSVALMLTSLDGHDDITELLQQGKRQQAFYTRRQRRCTLISWSCSCPM